MKRVYWFFFAILIIVAHLSGCAAYRAAGEVERGRYNLLTGKPELALAHFEHASRLDPDFVYRFSPLQQSVWTYLGRAYYQTGQLAEAEKALEQARSEYERDQIAKLYLGLVHARNGEYEEALPQIKEALENLHEWLDWMEYYTLYGHYWDPGRRLRKELQRDLDMIAGRDVDWPNLIASADWLGKELEEEIDRARYDESLHRRRRDKFPRLGPW